MTTTAAAAPTPLVPDSPPAVRARAGAWMALGSMVCVQAGVAASVGLFGQLGAEGTTALRLAWAGLLLLVLVRPRPSHFTGSTFAWCLLLGVVTAGMTLLFMASVARIPLGTAAALEFLGPLGVAVARGHGRARLWAVLAGGGVVLLTQPWHSDADPTGITLALGAAGCWAGYILLTQRVGDDVSGLRPLAVTMPVAALVALLVAAVQAALQPGPSPLLHLTWQLASSGLALALLLPVVPFSLELLALRRMTAAAFGTLMALEPAIALAVGVLALHQVPGPAAAAGVALVVTAGIGAERCRSQPR